MTRTGDSDSRGDAGGGVGDRLTAQRGGATARVRGGGALHVCVRRGGAGAAVRELPRLGEQPPPPPCPHAAPVIQNGSRRRRRHRRGQPRKDCCGRGGSAALKPQAGALHMTGQVWLRRLSHHARPDGQCCTATSDVTAVTASRQDSHGLVRRTHCGFGGRVAAPRQAGYAAAGDNRRPASHGGLLRVTVPAQ